MIEVGLFYLGKRLVFKTRVLYGIWQITNSIQARPGFAFHKKKLFKYQSRYKVCVDERKNVLSYFLPWKHAIFSLSEPRLGDLFNGLVVVSLHKKSIY